MAFILADAIRETTAVAGVAAVTVTGPVAGFRSFASACAVGDTFGYRIQHRLLGEWEIGVGTLTSPTTWTRTPLYSSAGTGLPCSFSTGDKDAMLVALADQSFLQKAGGTLTGPLVLAGAPSQPLHPATKQYADDLAAPKTRTIAGTSDTPSSADIGSFLRCTSGSPTVITAHDLGATGRYRVAQQGAGQVSIAAGLNVNLISDKSPPAFATLGRGSILDVMTDGAGNVLVSGATAAGVVAPTSGVYSGTLSLSAAPASYQVMQRTTRTGGAFGKGTSPVSIGLSATAAVTQLDYRLRDFDTPAGNALVDWTQAATSLPSGAQNVQLTLPATNKWYILDLRPNGDASKIVSTVARFGCGEVMALYGQDLVQDGITPTNNDTATTLASLSLAPTPLGSCYAVTANAAGTLSNNPPGWTLAADSGTAYRGALVAELLVRGVAATAVVCGIIGYGQAGQTIANLSSGAAYTNFTGLLTSGTQRGAGPGTFLFVQGQDDAKAGTSAASYTAALQSLIGALASAFPTSSFKSVIGTIGSHSDTTYVPTAANISAIRLGALNYASGLPTAAVVTPLDVTLHSDGWRYTQAGQRILARHLVRALATLHSIAAFGDAGPTITGASRAAGSANVVLSVAQAGGSALAASGTITGQFQVFNAGTTTGPLTVNSVALTNATTITLTLSAAPADGQALDVYYRRPADLAAALTGFIADNNTADGYTVGRTLAFSRTTAFACAAPGSVAWAPSAISSLVYATDPNDTTLVPDDGSGRVQFAKHLYDPAKYLQSPNGTNRPTLTINEGVSGTKRVMTLGFNKYLHAGGANFAALTNLFNGAFASTSGTIVLAVKLLADDGQWAEPFTWADTDANEYIDLKQRGTQTGNAQGGTSFQLRDAAATYKAMTSTDDTGWFVFSCVKATNSLTIRKTGTQVATVVYGGSDSFTAADFVMNATLSGGLVVNTGDAYTQALGGMVIAGSALSGSDLTNAEAWVKATIGMP